MIRRVEWIWPQSIVPRLGPEHLLRIADLTMPSRPAGSSALRHEDRDDRGLIVRQDRTRRAARIDQILTSRSAAARSVSSFFAKQNRSTGPPVSL